ncbi:hypothetical protein MIND_00532700 [Mycena indigotica]|uniref:Uncharacterized protein n=1 Tax=Mycena indigotica TaxID=2126181 RepID=A0A8H6SXS1_9AGAR|nr:uncharacterized protein MIND_00532700 [Mycena indigotica]KAF7307386.1 hypothetical protein MIND_00532700 [Mycena indigotica]
MKLVFAFRQSNLNLGACDREPYLFLPRYCHKSASFFLTTTCPHVQQTPTHRGSNRGFDLAVFRRLRSLESTSLSPFPHLSDYAIQDGSRMLVKLVKNDIQVAVLWVWRYCRDLTWATTGGVRECNLSVSLVLGALTLIP